METGRRERRARLVRTTSAAARLADVVCRSRLGAAERMVSQFCVSFAGRKDGGAPAPRLRSFSGGTTPLCARLVLPVSIQHRGRTAGNGCLVETGRVRRISRAGLAPLGRSGKSSAKRLSHSAFFGGPDAREEPT